MDVSELCNIRERGASLVLQTSVNYIVLEISLNVDVIKELIGAKVKRENTQHLSKFF